MPLAGLLDDFDDGGHGTPAKRKRDGGHGDEPAKEDAPSGDWLLAWDEAAAARPIKALFAPARALRPVADAVADLEARAKGAAPPPPERRHAVAAKVADHAVASFTGAAADVPESVAATLADDGGRLRRVVDDVAKSWDADHTGFEATIEKCALFIACIKFGWLSRIPSVDGAQKPWNVSQSERDFQVAETRELNFFAETENPDHARLSLVVTDDVLISAAQVRSEMDDAEVARAMGLGCVRAVSCWCEVDGDVATLAVDTLVQSAVDLKLSGSLAEANDAVMSGLNTLKNTKYDNDIRLKKADFALLLGCTTGGLRDAFAPERALSYPTSDSLSAPCVLRKSLYLTEHAALIPRAPFAYLTGINPSDLTFFKTSPRSSLESNSSNSSSNPAKRPWQFSHSSTSNKYPRWTRKPKEIAYIHAVLAHQPHVTFGAEATWATYGDGIVMAHFKVDNKEALVQHPDFAPDKETVYETCWRSTRNYCLEKEGGGKVRMDNCKPDRPCNFKPCTKCNK